ncbi:MAG: glycerate kinase [Planctomycetota bacterium]
MRVLCAPAPFKETLSALDAAAAMSMGVADAATSDRPAEATSCLVADGGDGTLDALVGAGGGQIRRVRVQGPLTRPPQRVVARLGLLPGGGMAVVELADASGLARVPPARRDPARTTTFGTGELIAAAVEAGATSIIIGIGGSATVDGATGLVQAMGGLFFDERGRAIREPLTGADLPRIARFQPSRMRPRLRVACDVTNPLLGPDGAAAVYGPQKGATLEQVRALEAGLAHLASLFPGVDPAQPGAGASGGAGFGLAAMCGARLEPGIDLVLDAVHFEQRCRDADLVLTGEGRLDAQSMQGKAAIGVADAAARLGVPTAAIVGQVGPGSEACLREQGGPIHECISLADRHGLDASMADTARLIRREAAQIVAERAGRVR